MGLLINHRGFGLRKITKMNHDLTEAFCLSAAARLAMDFENEAIINPMEAEGTLSFQRRVLAVLRKHRVVAADLRRPVIGDGVWTLLQYLRGNPEMPWNVLVLLRDWDSRYATTGYDFVEAWVGAQEFQGR